MEPPVTIKSLSLIVKLNDKYLNLNENTNIRVVEKSAKLPITDVLRLYHVDKMQCAIEAREIMSKNILTNQSWSDDFS